jgi:hypothetical protein
MEPLEDRFFLLANGSLHMPAYETSVDVEEFCIDYFAGERKKLLQGFDVWPAVMVM